MATQDVPKWLSEIQKQFGADILKPARELAPREYRGTGSLSLDIALGGGWGKRSIVRLQGKEGSGKTMLFDLAAIEAQKREGLRSAMFDFEGTYDIKRFIALGGDPTMLDLVDHDTVKEPMLFAETAFDILKSILINADTYACICFDSTGAMIAKAEFEAKMEYGQEKATPFHLGRVMSQGLAITNGLLHKSKTQPVIFYVSQGRDNIGAASFKGMPPQDKQTGGRALPFYASTIAEVRKGEIVKADVTDDVTGQSDKDVEVAHTTVVRIRKNKCNGVQGRTAEFTVYTLGGIHGIDRIAELAQLATYCGVIVRSGAWYDFNKEGNEDEVRFHVQGIDKVKVALEDARTFEVIDIQTRATLSRMMDTNAANEAESEDE